MSSTHTQTSRSQGRLSPRTGRYLLPLVIASVTLASGCAGMTESQQTTAKGAGIGAAAGAVIGGVTGGGRGAAIGAGVGAGVGALGGYVWSQRMEEQKRSMEQATKGTGVEVTQTADNQLKLEVPSDVSFDVGRADIKPNSGRSSTSSLKGSSRTRRPPCGSSVTPIVRAPTPSTTPSR